MKKLIPFVMALVLFSCQEEKPIDYAIISGKVLNANSDKVTIYNSYNYDDQKEISISEEGTFTDTITLDWNHKYSFREGRNGLGLYLSKGDQISITYDAKKLDSTLVISGIGSEVNDYLFKKDKLKGNFEELYKKEEADFKQAIADLKTNKLNLLDSQEGLPVDYITNEKNNIEYEYLNSINMYPRYHGYYTDNRGFTPSEGFDSELSSITYDKEEDFKFSSTYRSLITSIFSEKAYKSEDTLVAPEIQLINLYGTLENDLIRNKLLYSDAQFGITFANDLEGYYKAYMSASTDEAYNEKITKTYNALKLLGKGNSSPKFKDYENNAGGTSSLEDFEGKYVYIDVWATWCGPCIAEIPSLKKVEKKYHGKNIEFISISIDDKEDHGAWKKMIVDKELGGVQLFANNNWKSEFIESYMIKGIPRFILIDPSGNIVNSNAPRPSSESLTALFEELSI